MHFLQVAVAVMALVCRIHARGYGSTLGGLGGIPTGALGGIGGRSGAAGIGGRPGVGGGGGGSYIGGVYVPGSVGGIGGSGQDMSPKPYSMGFNAPDGEGGASFRSEQADGSGAVQGSYGYRDAQGLYRMVQYLADQYGFRAVVNTNEPGVDGKENPADVTMNVEGTPAGIQEQYTVQPGFGAGGAGGRSVGGIGPGGLLGGRSGYPGSLAGGVSRGYPGGFGGRQGYPGSSAGGMPGRYPGGQPGFPGSLSGGFSGGFPGGLGGGRGGIAGVGSSGGFGALSGGIGSGLPGGAAQNIGGSSGIFSGISRSSTGKSVY